MRVISRYGHFAKIGVAPRYRPVWMQVAASLFMLLDGITGLIMAPFRRYGTIYYSAYCVYMLQYGISVRKQEREEAARGDRGNEERA